MLKKLKLKQKAEMWKLRREQTYYREENRMRKWDVSVEHQNQETEKKKTTRREQETNKMA